MGLVYIHHGGKTVGYATSSVSLVCLSAFKDLICLCVSSVIIFSLCASSLNILVAHFCLHA